ncbi:MAG: glycosyltransferase family 39 protein [Candidatus Tectomicrobia bacterium]|uniref:Glycosyltransferase family 39 protein n=1 Tax=Tectimicrobiota bacterium TaxID=2528274 RepID=A0A933GMC5_UNCTE|nr:glycosyltransferase family 39 protein [Candidatus Tectomicrobia bacterium]
MAKPLADNKKDFIIAAILFLATLIILIYTLNDIGITIDEPYRNRPAAKRFMGWLSSALRDILAGEWKTFSSREVIDQVFKFPYSYHPPFARFLAGITWQLFHGSLGEMASLRLAPALLFSLSVALLYLLVAEHYDVLSGLIASLSLFFIPATFGHAHLLALDSPIASMWFFSVFCFIKGIKRPWWSVIWAVVWALSLNTKIHAYFLPLPLFLWAFFFHRERSTNNFFAMFFISPVVLLITNPFLWPNPVNRLLAFLADMVSKGHYEPIPSFFLGNKYHSILPWFYPFFMTAVTIPVTVIGLSVAGIGRGFTLEMKGVSGEKPHFHLGALFVFNALGALSLASIKGIPAYDGVRLFLPAFTFIAGLAAIGFFQFRQWVEIFFAKKGIKTWVLGLAAGMVLIPQVYSLIKIHPFELSYFNTIIGGPEGAKNWGLESTYWNDAFNGKVVKFLNENFPRKTFSTQAGLKVSFDYYREIGQLRADIKYDAKRYDYYILYFRQGWFDPERWFYARYMKPIYEVKVDNVPLLAIYDTLRAASKKFSLNAPETSSDFKDENQNRAYTLAYEAESSGEDLIPDTQLKSGGSTTFSPVKVGWEGILRIPEEGEYLFSALVLGNFNLKLDGNSVFQISSPYQFVIHEQTIGLKKGFFLLAGEFTSSVPEGKIYLAWSTPKGARTLLPVYWLKESIHGGER